MFDAQHKYRGIMRNKIAELNHFKGKKKTPVKRFSKASLRKTIQEQTMNKSSLLSVQTKPSEIEMTWVEEPEWMGTYKECVNLMKDVQLLQNEIAKQKMKKMSSVSEEKHNKVIQQFVQEATTKLNKCQSKIKEMQRTANFDGDATATEKRTFSNVIVSMAGGIRDQTRKLRSQQQSQLHRERELNNCSKNANILDINTQSSQTENWLSEDMLKVRNQEINKIVQSIYSLNTIYKDLQGIVIEQGTLLDRIDQNIDKSVVSVIQARKHLEKAKEKQESGCLKKLRRFLVAAICILLLIFFIKHI